jgi:hypothetical protein
VAPPLEDLAEVLGQGVVLTLVEAACHPCTLHQILRPAAVLDVDPVDVSPEDQWLTRSVWQPAERQALAWSGV